MTRLTVDDVMAVILQIAGSVSYKALLNERYLHHFFSHLMQQHRSVLDLAGDTTLRLHPEWPTYKKKTNLHYGRYRGDLNTYRPDKDGTSGFVDFTVGNYDKPDIGVEFTLSYGWSTEKVMPDCIKLMDIENPFEAAISYNLVLRSKGLTQGGHLTNFQNAMDDAPRVAFDRLRSENRLCGSERKLYLIVTEVDMCNERRHWQLNEIGFLRGLPYAPLI